LVATGYKQSLFWGDEDGAYGSADAVDSSIGLVQSVNPTETNNLIKVRTLGGDRDYSNIVPGKFEVSGGFEYFLQDGAFLRQAIGEDTSSTATIDSGPQFHTGAATYLHVMGSANSPEPDNFPSFTLELTDAEDTGAYSTTGNLKRKYNGCRVNNLSISGAVDTPLSVNCDWIAQGVIVSTAAASSVTQNTDDPYVFYQGWIYATTGTIGAYTDMDSTSAIAEVNSFDFSVNNNLEAGWYVSGTTATTQDLRGLKHLIPKGRDYDGSLDLHFKDKTMYQRFLGAAAATRSSATLTSYKVVLDFVRTGVIAAAASARTANDDWIRILLNNCKFDTMNITGAPEDLVSESIGLAIESAIVYVVDAISSYS